MAGKHKTTRAIAVQLSTKTIERLDELAARSGIKRHRYMVLILERAVSKGITLSEQVTLSEEL